MSELLIHPDQGQKNKTWTSFTVAMKQVQELRTLLQLWVSVSAHTHIPSTGLWQASRTETQVKKNNLWFLIWEILYASNNTGKEHPKLWVSLFCRMLFVLLAQKREFFLIFQNVKYRQSHPPLVGSVVGFSPFFFNIKATFFCEKPMKYVLRITSVPGNF